MRGTARGASIPQVWLLCHALGPDTAGCEPPDRHLAQEAYGDDGLEGVFPPQPPFLPQGDEQPFRSVLRHLNVVQQVLHVGERGLSLIHI